MNHFDEAVRLVEEANHVGHSDHERAQGIIACAQVHATLAVAQQLYANHNEERHP